jgi:hypothetical protein
MNILSTLDMTVLNRMFLDVEYEDDEDEDMWLGDIGDEYMDEDILIQFLNEYYVVFPKKLPEAESE